MAFLTPDDIPATFGPAGFSISLEHAWYRIALVRFECPRDLI